MPLAAGTDIYASQSLPVFLAFNQHADPPMLFTMHSGPSHVTACSRILLSLCTLALLTMSILCAFIGQRVCSFVFVVHLDGGDTYVLATWDCVTEITPVFDPAWDFAAPPAAPSLPVRNNNSNDDLGGDVLYHPPIYYKLT